MGVLRNGVSLSTVLALAMGVSAAWAHGAPDAPAAPPAPEASAPAAATPAPPPAATAATPAEQPAAPPLVQPPPAARPVLPPPPVVTPAAAPTALPTALTAVPPAPAVEAEDMVEIHIESPSPVQLIRRHGDNTDWYSVCNSPCDVAVPRADQLMIMGKEIYRSKPFQISADKGKRVTLYVTPGRKDKHRMGLLALGAGGVLALGGVIVLAAGITPSSTFDNDGQTHNENTTAIAAGSLLLVGAVTAGITGGAWTVENIKTRVEVDGASREQNREPGQPAQTGLPAPHAMAPAFAIPLFRGTF